MTKYLSFMLRYSYRSATWPFSGKIRIMGESGDSIFFGRFQAMILSVSGYQRLHLPTAIRSPPPSLLPALPSTLPPSPSFCPSAPITYCPTNGASPTTSISPTSRCCRTSSSCSGAHGGGAEAPRPSEIVVPTAATS